MFKNSTGNCNTGEWNTGNCNTGYRNTGDRNTGNCNTGYRNTGDRNTGDRNTGYRNTGDRNTGNWNTGNWNTGNWNTGDWNAGYFNTNTPDTVRAFNKDCPRTEWENAEKPALLFFSTTEWVSENDMSDDEKINNPTFTITGGYLKVYDYKIAFQKSWDSASEEDREKVKALPNFDPDVFFEISGIDLRTNKPDCEGRTVTIDGVEYELVKKEIEW